MARGQSHPQTPPMEPVGSKNRVPTPLTPRYAPIDEPDQFWLPAGNYTSKHKQKAMRSQTAPSIGNHTSLSPGESHQKTLASRSETAVVQNLLLTPEATPARRKRHYDELSKTSRALFPAKASAQGRGHCTKRQAFDTKDTIPRGESSFLLKMRRTEDEHEDHHHTAHIPVSEEETDIDEEILKTTLPLEDPGTPVVDSEDEDDEEPTSFALNVKTYTKDTVPANMPGMWYIFRGKKVFRPFADAKQAADIMSIKPKRLFGSAPSTSPSKPKKNPFVSRLEATNKEEANEPIDSTDDDTETSDQLLAQLREFRKSRRQMRFAFR